MPASGWKPTVKNNPVQSEHDTKWRYTSSAPPLFFIFSSAQSPGFPSLHLNGFLYSFHKKTVHKSDCSDLCTACIRSPLTRVFVSYSRFVRLLLKKFLQFLSQSLTSQIFTNHHTVCINQIHCRYKLHLIECSDSCFI